MCRSGEAPRESHPWIDLTWRLQEATGWEWAMAHDSIAVAFAGGYNGCELWGVYQYQDPKRPCNRYRKGCGG
jgi:hypothetical protein